MDGTARAGADYVATNGTLTFAPGQTTRVLTILLLNDTAPEGEETVEITLSAEVNATIEGPNPIYLTIEDQDRYTGYLPIVWNR